MMLISIYCALLPLEAKLLVKGLATDDLAD